MPRGWYSFCSSTSSSRTSFTFADAAFARSLAFCGLVAREDERLEQPLQVRARHAACRALRACSVVGVPHEGRGPRERVLCVDAGERVAHDGGHHRVVGDHVDRVARAAVGPVRRVRNVGTATTPVVASSEGSGASSSGIGLSWVFVFFVFVACVFVTCVGVGMRGRFGVARGARRLGLRSGVGLGVERPRVVLLAGPRRPRRTPRRRAARAGRSARAS